MELSLIATIDYTKLNEGSVCYVLHLASKSRIISDLLKIPLHAGSRTKIKTNNPRKYKEKYQISTLDFGSLNRFFHLHSSAPPKQISESIRLIYFQFLYDVHFSVT
jgi:hypothetical protein